MKKLRIFKCEVGNCKLEQERLVADHVKIVECEKCKGKATKQLSAPRSFGNTTGKSPSTRY